MAKRELSMKHQDIRFALVTNPGQSDYWFPVQLIARHKQRKNLLKIRPLGTENEFYEEHENLIEPFDGKKAAFFTQLVKDQWSSNERFTDAITEMNKIRNEMNPPQNYQVLKWLRLGFYFQIFQHFQNMWK